MNSITMTTEEARATLNLFKAERKIESGKGGITLDASDGRKAMLIWDYSVLEHPPTAQAVNNRRVGKFDLIFLEEGESLAE